MTKLDNLSKELQKYYTRKGNRIVFANGMSLNQLALVMWERLDYEGIDASVISRVLKGERLFTPSQLDVFADLLNLKGKSKTDLQNILIVELSRRYGMENILSNKLALEEIAKLTHELVKVKDFSLYGSRKEAYEWIEQVQQQVENIASDNDLNNRDEINRLLSDVILEKLYLINTTFSKRVILGSAKVQLKLLKKVAHELKDSNLTRLANYIWGDSLYIAGRYNEAMEFFHLGLKDGPLETGYYNNKNLVFHTVALALAYTKNSEFEIVKRKLIKQSTRLSNSLKCRLYESLARGEAAMGNYNSAGGYLSSAWNTYDELKVEKGNSRSYTKVQLIRTELETASIFKDKKKVRKFEALAKEGLLLSETFHYDRYKDHINHYMKKYL